MPTSFEILCDYIREQIDAKKPNTIREVKTALGLNATIDLNNLSKTVLTNGISKVKDDETITLTYAGILIEIVMFYVKNQKNYEKQLSALTKYIERLKNKKFTLAETVKILKKLGLEQSDFYKTVTNKDTYKNICESAKGLLQKVDMEKITDYGIDSKDKANITSAIEKVGSETEVTDTDLEVKDLEELLQILENIKATCKDETIGDPETLLSELNLLLPETPIESLKNEIEYLRLVIKNDYSVSEQQKQEVLQKCSETTKQKLNKAENRIINRLKDFTILGLNESPKPTGPQNRMAVNPAKIKAAQRKNLALMQKINTAYHEALEKVGNDKSKIDEITTSILDKLKGTLNGSEELSYYQGEYNPEYRGSNLIEIEELEKAMDNPKEALNYVGYIPLSWKNGKIPTIGSQRKPQPGQNKAPTQPQPTPQPTPTPTNVQTQTNQNPQVQQYQSGQQTVVQQPANPIIQQPPQQMQYQQQTVQPQANAQQPVLNTPTQPMQGPPTQYFQQYYPGQQMYPPYQQNYYPQAQQFYSNPQQMAYQPPIQYPPKSAAKQNPHQQGQGAKPTKPSHQLHDSKIIQMKKKTVKEAKENMQKNLTELSQQINATWTNVRKLEERINTLATAKGFDDQHQNYLSKLGPYLKEKLRQLETTYNEAKKYFDQSKTVRIYGITDPAKLQTAQTEIAKANDWTTKSLTGLKNFKAELTNIETTLDKEYSQIPTGQSPVPDQKDEQPLETMEQANSAEQNQQSDENATENAQNQQPPQDTTNGAGGENKTEEQNTDENKKHEESDNTTEEQKADEKDKHQEEKGEDDTSGTSSSNPANDTKDPSSIPNSEPNSK